MGSTEPLYLVVVPDELVSWDEKQHPELKQGTSKWVRKLRRETERRFKKVTAR